MTAKGHQYHLVKPSPWPAVGAVAAFLLTLGAVISFHGGTSWILVIGVFLTLYTMFMWFRDVILEGEGGVDQVGENKERGEKEQPRAQGGEAVAASESVYEVKSAKENKSDDEGGVEGRSEVTEGGFCLGVFLGPAVFRGVIEALKLSGESGVEGFQVEQPGAGLERVLADDGC